MKLQTMDTIYAITVTHLEDCKLRLFHLRLEALSCLVHQNFEMLPKLEEAISLELRRIKGLFLRLLYLNATR